MKSIVCRVRYVKRVSWNLQPYYAGFHTGALEYPPPPQDFEIQYDVIIIIMYTRAMNKQINSINGYSCVQAQVKVQFYDFSA